jgi:hypothetical protein
LFARNGKHKQIVSLILKDLEQLHDGAAIKVPLKELTETKEQGALRSQSRDSQSWTERRDRD